MENFIFCAVCKAFSSAEKLYKNLSDNCNLLPSSESSNHVLAYVTGAVIQEILLIFNNGKTNKISEKDLLLNCLPYLGYLFGIFYRGICRSTKNTSLASNVVSFLMAGKDVGKNFTLPERKDVNVMDRGGLWKVNENVKIMLKIAECYFTV